MYCQASSSQFNESQNLPFCYLAGKIKNLSAVKYDGLKLTKVLFEFLTFIVRKNILTLYFLGEKVAIQSGSVLAKKMFYCCTL